MERIVSFTPAYEQGKIGDSDRGIGAMLIRFVLKGELGAVQLLLGTNWYTRSVQRNFYDHPYPFFEIEPKGWELGYHSPKPMHEGETPVDEACEWLDGKPCYYDGSSLAADPIRDRFLLEGDAAVWEELEQCYIDTFGEAR